MCTDGILPSLQSSPNAALRRHQCVVSLVHGPCESRKVCFVRHGCTPQFQGPWRRYLSVSYDIVFVAAISSRSPSPHAPPNSIPRSLVSLTTSLYLPSCVAWQLPSPLAARHVATAGRPTRRKSAPGLRFRPLSPAFRRHAPMLAARKATAARTVDARAILPLVSIVRRFDGGWTNANDPEPHDPHPHPNESRDSCPGDESDRWLASSSSHQEEKQVGCMRFTSEETTCKTTCMVHANVGVLLSASCTRAHQQIALVGINKQGMEKMIRAMNAVLVATMTEPLQTKVGP